ncbi:MAG: adenylate/guanylate cyclase domain-containing protein [Armatimonadota bacterium]
MTTKGQTAEVTLVFTDIEASSRLWDRHGARFAEALRDHDRIIRETATRNSGREVKHQGDGFMLAFASPSAAVRFALAAQEELANLEWSSGTGSLRVRIGIHSGMAIRMPTAGGAVDYFGPVVNRAARVSDAGHGGQVLMSATTARMVEAQLPEAVGLVSLGLHRLKGLQEPEEIFQLVWPEVEEITFPPLRTLDLHNHNLPVQLTSFVGRDADVAVLQAALDAPEYRLITLLGPGGAGKTRLALQGAAECIHHFQDGVWLIELAEIEDPALIPEEIATTVGLQLSDPQTELVAQLSDREMLLVLDNFEHLSSAAPIVADLLKTAPGVQCLVTSRQALRIAGERVISVEPMSVPSPGMPLDHLVQCDSVQLLTDRIRLHRPGWSVNADNAGNVAELCTALEGIPLAIELAASRLTRMSLRDVVKRLSDRFALLKTRRADGPTRQQTLLDTIAWSYDLLPGHLQELLGDVSIFCGGFNLDAAAAICESDDVFEGVLDLCEHSLISHVEADESRYTVLETIREFASRSVTDSHAAELQKRHCSYFLRLAQELDASEGGPDEAEAFSRMERDLANMRE